MQTGTKKCAKIRVAKKRIMAIALTGVILLILFGCVTTSVGVGYHFPISNNAGIGLGFGVGF